MSNILQEESNDSEDEAIDLANKARIRKEKAKDGPQRGKATIFKKGQSKRVYLSDKKVQGIIKEVCAST